MIKFSSAYPGRQKAKHTVRGLLTITLRKAQTSNGPFPKLFMGSFAGFQLKNTTGAKARK